MMAMMVQVAEEGKGKRGGGGGGTRCGMVSKPPPTEPSASLAGCPQSQQG